MTNIADGEVIHLDRWKVEVEKNTDAEPNEEGKPNLPLNVMNNYFSFGVDAHIALEFHEARGQLVFYPYFYSLKIDIIDSFFYFIL